MSAVLRDERLLLPMTTQQLDAVLEIELQAYPFPWTRGNFIDSLAAGYPAQVLYGVQGELLGYFIAMEGVDELHLLNITVAPAAATGGCPSPRACGAGAQSTCATSRLITTACSRCPCGAG